MKGGARIKALLVFGIGAGVAAALAAPARAMFDLGQGITWQQKASPDRLSGAHAFLENNCAACHTSVKGPDPAKCIACHASNEALLQRQPTAFHANIGSCRECHVEHQGIDRQPTAMDHTALARIGLRQISQSAESGDSPP